MRTKHDELMNDPAFRKELAVELLVAEAAELVCHLMAQRGMSKADLARELNKSRAWVTQLLSGKNNVTIRTLAEVVHALGGKIELMSAAQPEQKNDAWKPFRDGNRILRMEHRSHFVRRADEPDRESIGELLPPDDFSSEERIA